MSIQGADESRIFNLLMDTAPEDRDDVLARECGDDVDLRARVSAMLAAGEDQPARSSPAVQATVASPTGEGPGETIDRYKLLQLIGEGGFGSVWLAEQREPVQRRVALKIIKLGMDTKQVVARFEAERQALAILDHPNIAKVLDAGSTATGRPYFVMEYIDGVPIVEYCDNERLNTKARLKLFVQVCQAIQHAHHKGIIHRDIKPGNILVTLHDGQPVPRVIDFGIAKATQTALTQKTLFTEYRQLIGTPAYMSPEQAGVTGLDVDTRADIYSLGVLLYELLTGSTPFDTTTLMAAGYAEMMRIIRDEEPPRPSTRVSATRETLAGLAAKRHTDPHKLGSLIRGELDWIVMKAIEKERARRYETASAMADDIQRFLAGAAVSAAPPSTVYRVRKFVRRNRAGVTAATLVMLSLLIGIFAFGWQARIAEQQRDVADAERTKAREAEARANARAEELQMVSEFQSMMLTDIDLPKVGSQLTRDVRARLEATFDVTSASDEERQALMDAFERLWDYVNATDVAVGVIDRAIFERSVEALDEAFQDHPEIDASLRQAIADRYQEFGLFDDALPLQRQALDTRREVLGDSHPETLHSLLVMSMLTQRMGRHAEALALKLEVVENRRRTLGDDHPDTLTALNSAAYQYYVLGRFDEAEQFWREFVEGWKGRSSLDSEPAMRAISRLGDLMSLQGRHDEAEVLYREALTERERTLGNEDGITILSRIQLSESLARQRKSIEAAAHLDEALAAYQREMARTRTGERTDFQRMGGLSARIGYMFHDRGDLSRAEPFYRDSMELKRQRLGEEHQYTILESINLGKLLVTMGRLEEAAPLIFEGLQTSQRRLGLHNNVTRRAMHAMGALLLAQDKPIEAEPYYVGLLGLQQQAYQGQHSRIAQVLGELASVRHAMGRDDEARAGFDEAIAMHRRLTPDGSGPMAQALWLSGKASMAHEDWDRALDALSEAVEISDRVLSPEHPGRATYRATLEACRDAAGR